VRCQRARLRLKAGFIGIFVNIVEGAMLDNIADRVIGIYSVVSRAVKVTVSNATASSFETQLIAASDEVAVEYLAVRTGNLQCMILVSNDRQSDNSRVL
jgi:hypothetical protein